MSDLFQKELHYKSQSSQLAYYLLALTLSALGYSIYLIDNLEDSRCAIYLIIGAAYLFLAMLFGIFARFYGRFQAHADVMIASHEDRRNGAQDILKSLEEEDKREGWNHGSQESSMNRELRSAEYDSWEAIEKYEVEKERSFRVMSALAIGIVFIVLYKGMNFAWMQLITDLT